METSTKIASADGELTVAAVEGDTGDVHAHLFRRSDGRQVLFLWMKKGNAVVRVRLQQAGKSAVRYDLAGWQQTYNAFDGLTLGRITLTAGEVSIFQIEP